MTHARFDADDHIREAGLDAWAAMLEYQQAERDADAEVAS